MADVVTRLVVESKEYDSKISRATQGLTQFEKKCREVGGTLEFVEKEDLDFVKALGQMDTVASTATGKLGELKKAFTELSVQYKNLTDAEKRSPYGQALSSSIDQLKVRIKGLEGDLQSAQSDLANTGDIFRNLASKVGLPVEMLGKLGIATAAVGTAIKIAGDALKQNELVVDEWGRTTEAAGALYDGFLNSLNTGDISGFLKTIGKIITKARDAYDAMDKLGTFNAFNQINVERGRTGLADAITNFREGTGSKEDVQAARNFFVQQLQDRKKLESKAYQDAIKELAAKRNVDADLLTKALSGTYGDYETLKNTPMGQRSKTYIDMDGNSFVGVEEVAITPEQKIGQMLRKLNDTELADIQALGAAAQRTATEIEQVDRQVQRAMGKGQVAGAAIGSSPATGDVAYATDSIKAQEDEVARLTKLWKEASAELRDGYKAQLDKAKATLEEMTRPVQELKGQMSFDVDPIKIKVDTGNIKLANKDAKDMRLAFSAAASAVSTVGAALQQIDDPAAKIAGIVATAIANITLGFAQATASPATTVAGVFGWIAAATTGLATMISTISAIKSVTSAGKFAEGGVVGGNSYSGDRLMAYVNSGETILNRRQAQTVLDGLQGAGQQGGSSSTPYVSGENIVLGVNNYFGRSGQGEIVTTSMLRRAGINI